jgi:hypothetical protein
VGGSVSDASVTTPSSFCGIHCCCCCFSLSTYSSNVALQLQLYTSCSTGTEPSLDRLRDNEGNHTRLRHCSSTVVLYRTFGSMGLCRKERLHAYENSNRAALLHHSRHCPDSGEEDPSAFLLGRSHGQETRGVDHHGEYAYSMCNFVSYADPQPPLSIMPPLVL